MAFGTNGSSGRSNDNSCHGGSAPSRSWAAWLQAPPGGLVDMTDRGTRVRADPRPDTSSGTLTDGPATSQRVG